MAHLCCLTEYAKLAEATTKKRLFQSKTNENAEKWGFAKMQIPFFMYGKSLSGLTIYGMMKHKATRKEAETNVEFGKSNFGNK